jgi:hypothetical protein
MGSWMFLMYLMYLELECKFWLGNQILFAM